MTEFYIKIHKSKTNYQAEEIFLQFRHSPKSMSRQQEQLFDSIDTLKVCLRTKYFIKNQKELKWWGGMITKN